VRPVLLPLADHVSRFALRRRGVESRWVRTPGASVHVYDASGSGRLPTTVLFHGIGSAATSFGALLVRLQPEVRRLLAPDYPGHGFSGEHPRLTPRALIETMTTTVDTLVDEPVVVLGHSLGGAIALHFALARPEKVRALILLSPAGARASDEEWAELRRTFDITKTAEARVFLDRLYHATPWFMPLFAFELPERMGRKAVRELLDGASNDDALGPEDLAKLTMPILLLWGQSERLLPATHYEYFASHLPSHAILERPAGFGHCPHFDAPGVLSRRILEFLRTAT
jgi:pimeloyl-ACP methyl ester carboxylesterase